MGVGVRFRIALAGRALRIHGPQFDHIHASTAYIYIYVYVYIDMHIHMHMDSQRAAGQGEAKAHSKTHRGALRAPPGAHRGHLGLWVLLRLRLALAGRALRIRALFSGLVLRSELILVNPAISPFFGGLFGELSVVRRSPHISVRRTHGF